MFYKTLVVITLFLAVSIGGLAADVAGMWTAQVPGRNGTRDTKFTFKVDGDKLSGTLNEIKIEGTAQDGALKFTATRPNGDRFGTFEGRASGSELAGTAHVGDEPVAMGLRPTRM